MTEDRQPHQQALIEASSVPPPGSTPWSKGLGSLLLAAADDGGSRRASSIRLIAINPTLRAEAERILPVLESLKAPAQRAEVIAIIMREMPAWGVGSKQAAEFGVTYASYADALEGLSAYLVEEAVVRWNNGQRQGSLKDAGFPPRPAQLAMLAQEARNELYMAAYRAKLALQYVEKEIPRQITEEERKEVGPMFRELAAAPRPSFPPQPPGITMADWIRKCREEGLVNEPGAEPPRAPGQTKAEMAEALRAHAAAEDDPGDVI